MNNYVLDSALLLFSDTVAHQLAADDPRRLSDAVQALGQDYATIF